MINNVNYEETEAFITYIWKDGDIIDLEARNIEYVTGLWYCYLIHELFNDSFDEFQNFVNRVKNDSKLSKDDIKLVQLCLSESLLRKIAKDLIKVKAKQIRAYKDLMKERKECVFGLVRIYTKVKDRLLTHFKYCEENYNETNLEKFPRVHFPYALEAVKQHTVKSEEFQEVTIPDLYFPFKGTFETMYTVIQRSFKVVVNSECSRKLDLLFKAFNLKFEDADFSNTMAEARFIYLQQQLEDKLSEFIFREAAYGQPITYTSDCYIRSNNLQLNGFLKEKARKKSEFLKMLDKMFEKFIEETMTKK